jgi:hypothetical protein
MKILALTSYGHSINPSYRVRRLFKTLLLNFISADIVTDLAIGIIILE